MVSSVHQFVFFLVCISNVFAAEDASHKLESDLIKELMEPYVRSARPVVKNKDSVNMSVQISLVGVEDIDERTSSLTTTLLLAQSWDDPRLSWNSTKYGGVSILRLPLKDIWTPDVVPFNAVGLREGVSRYDELPTILPTGTVFWVPMVSWTTRCSIDVTNFPFDTQECKVVFGSWTHSSGELHISFMGGDSNNIDLSLTDSDTTWPTSSHPNWELKSAKANLNKIKYSCCEDPYIIITMTVRMERKSTFYRLLALGPAAVMGFLVPLLFLVPSRSEGKTTFGMLLIIAVTLLILTLEDDIPFTHNTAPKIAYFYLFTMGLSSCSVMLSILVNNLSVRGVRHKPLPAWLRWVCLSRNGFRRLFCIGDYAPVDNMYSVSLKDLHRPDPEVHGDDAEAAHTEPNSDMDEIKRYLRYLVGKHSADSAYQNVCQEWEELARVFDRILFVVFFMMYVLFAVNLLT